MSKELITIPSYNDSQLKLIRDTVARDCNPAEFDLFMEICKQTGLDPFKKHIYAFVFKKTRKTKINNVWTEIEERNLTPVTGIDGYRSMAQRSGSFRPADTEPQFVQDEAAICPHSNPEGIVKCIVVVYQWGNDNQYHPVVGSARWKEYAPIIEDGEWVDRKFQGNGNYVLDRKKPNWKKMPFIMLAKCAEAQALRKGWEMGGVYVREEMDSPDTDQTASEKLVEHEEKERMDRVAGNDSISIVLAQTEGLQSLPMGQFYDRVMEHAMGFEDAQQLSFWRDNNVLALQQFWAKNPSEAHDLKVAMEAQIEVLQKHHDAVTLEQEDNKNAASA